MELRSSSATKFDGEERSKTNVKAMPSNGSDSGTSSGARNRKNGSVMSNSKKSSSGRRTSPAESSCSNNEHCPKNNTPLAQRDNASLHDGTNGQVMGYPGNSPPASSASSAHSRQRDVLLYGFFSLCSVV